MRLSLVALLLALTACVKLPTYDGTRMLAHPTMTTDAIGFGLDARVHAAAEGARGGPGGPVTCGCD